MMRARMTQTTNQSKFPILEFEVVNFQRNGEQIEDMNRSFTKRRGVRCAVVVLRYHRFQIHGLIPIFLIVN